MSVESSLPQEENSLLAGALANWQLPVLVVLFVSVVFVSIKTVVHRHEARTAFVKLQTLEKERDKLAAQWSRLKLEQATTLNQVRVEQYARWDLNMKMPKASEVKIIQEPETMSAIAVKEDAANERNVKVSGSVMEAAKPTKVVLDN